MRRALLAFGSDSTSKCSASRIRRRSRKHLIEAYVLGGAMKNYSDGDRYATVVARPGALTGRSSMHTINIRNLNMRLALELKSDVSNSSSSSGSSSGGRRK
jgi:hypothetical protein